MWCQIKTPLTKEDLAGIIEKSKTVGSPKASKSYRDAVQIELLCTRRSAFFMRSIIHPKLTSEGGYYKL